jgi:hypothetical protein
MTRYIPPNDAEFLAWMNNTNRVGKVHKLLRVQNPPTPCPLPPYQGGRGSG